MSPRTLSIALLAAFAVVGVGCNDGKETKKSAQPSRPMAVAPQDVRALADNAISAGLAYLRSQQADDGSIGGNFTTAFTAMAVKAMVQAGEPADSPSVAKAIAFILSAQQTEGPLRGAFADKQYANYNTSIALSTLCLVNSKLADKPHDSAIKAGLDFLRRDQWDESEGITEANAAYGGFGYGDGERPDMSSTNTTYDALDALVAAGYITRDDPMFEKGKVFLQRNQNRSESNDVGTFAVGNDGGFIYTPAVSPSRGGAESKAGSVTLPDGRSGLRSYGSMTYAGFKSYVYSGLTMDDPRVQDAFNWIRESYTLQVNPGMPEAQIHEGLFYYYHTFARALRAAKVDTIIDPAGVAHDWRADLVRQFGALQKSDGSWVNTDPRWGEDNPILATCFAVLALQEAVATD